MSEKDFQPPDEIMSFADGLRAFHTKGIVGPPLRLTKKRANALRYLSKQMVYCVPDCEHSRTGVDDCDCGDDYHAAIAWINQQIDKRFSNADLAL